MAKPFSIDCSCGKEVCFDIEDVGGLEAFIDGEKRDAADDARDECDCDDVVDPASLPGRPFYDLSVAIERADMSEARILLERIAAELDGSSGELSEQVQRGRFSPEARRTGALEYRPASLYSLDGKWLA